jgi:AraC-like DNA-binding protein
LRSGFADGNYFARQFKRYTGIAPREYRKLGPASGQAGLGKELDGCRPLACRAAPKGSGRA